MMHLYLRPIELVVGVIVLLSVASVPVPKAPPAVRSLPPVTMARVEDLHRQAQAQSNEVSSLVQETRRLSELLRAQQEGDPSRGITHGGAGRGTVGPQDPRNLAVSVRDGVVHGAPHGNTE